MLIASDSVPSREEVDCHNSEMSVPACRNSSDDQGGFRIDRHVISWCTSKVLALQAVTNDSDKGYFRIPVIQCSNTSTSTMQGGTDLVDSQCETM